MLAAEYRRVVVDHDRHAIIIQGQRGDFYIAGSLAVKGRNVQVHKFVVAGTLEERINDLIESKQALAQSIVGSGEDWLTELDTEQLRDLLMLRYDAIEDE